MRDGASGIRLVVLSAVVLALLPRAAGAHCDTLDGPVVAAAREALEKGDVTPVLKWVKKEYEPEIRSAFERTMAVRGESPEAKELADVYLFETLVRLHRVGEGATFTGLKPAGTALEPAVAGADATLEDGSVEALIRLVTGDVAAGIRGRYARAAKARTHVDETVDAGRAYVEAYVDYVHYVERVHVAAADGLPHGIPGTAAQQHHAQ